MSNVIWFECLCCNAVQSWSAAQRVRTLACLIQRLCLLHSEQQSSAAQLCGAEKPEACCRVQDTIPIHAAIVSQRLATAALVQGGGSAWVREQVKILSGNRCVGTWLAACYSERTGAVP